MCPEKNPNYRQVQLPFPKKTLWEKFPEPVRVGCRQRLSQILQQVVPNASNERNRDEREA